ncbi:uncharacterized protein LOC124857809 isoform X2 [Girardinichthys multiradiatus]|uniref:uncharacterized protein LOC124857809 isoform X2 n=1 Tax=Girardinichthys multiradiatus TaxID=208333 RepID=UPI001FAB9B3A|nr:uncharacterized protein LOC124857809 isoform X2 [Girardinichthys multiradiatus]
MEFEGISQTHCSQCPAHSALVRRNVEVRLVESSNSKAGLAASGPKVSLQLSSYVCRDCGVCMAHHYHDEVEREDDVVYVTGEDMERAKDEAGTAAAQMPKTKPKARALVARRQLSDGDEADSLREIIHDLRVTAAVKWANPRGTSSHQATTSDRTSQAYSDLCKQLDDPKLQTEKERSKNTKDVHASCIWWLPGSRAPHCPLGTAKRTKCLHTAGILPQEQIRVKGFSGTPFRLP